MSENQIPVPNVDSQAEASRAPCCAVAGPWQAAALRAVIYVPALLLTSAFAAAAMFPNLAEYATPLIDLRMKCPLSIGCSSGSTPPCCQQQGLMSPCQGTANGAANQTEPETSADEIPADAMAAVNALDLETFSN